MAASTPPQATNAARPRLALTRQFWVVLHRWAGLTLTLFLGIAGFTGIFLAWIDELEVASAPELHLSAPPYAGAAPIDPMQLRQDVLNRYPGASIDFVPLQVEPGRSLRFHLEWLDPNTGLEGDDHPDWDDLFLDPYTGKELGRRAWGDISQGMKNLMPFVYRLHYSLALGDWGMFVFGVAALIWVLDCFVGFYLTLPVRKKQACQQGENWLKRWKSSWRVRLSASRYKLNFDLHRAGGLWLWPLLLIFAWSSVSFNLPQVYVPVMKQLGASDPREAYFDAMLPAPRLSPSMTFGQALERGQELAVWESRKAGLAMRQDGENYLWHTPFTGMYIYYFTTEADISKHGAGTFVAFDSNTGALRHFDAPTGRNAANTVTTWISMLHTAHVFGLPWRIITSLLGALVTMLCVTGVVIWLRKRSARLLRR